MFSSSYNQGVTKRSRLSWLTNCAFVYESKCGGSCEVSAYEYSYTGAQINFGDLTPYFTYVANHGKKQLCILLAPCITYIFHACQVQRRKGLKQGIQACPVGRQTKGVACRGFCSVRQLLHVPGIVYCDPWTKYL